MEVQAKCSTFFNNQMRSAATTTTDHDHDHDHDHVDYPALSRKRSRRDISDHQFRYFIENQHHQHQLELDSLISLHNEKVRLDIEERRKKYGRWMIGILEEGSEGILTKTAILLKRKDEEIENIGKLNWALQERLKCLFTENQIWRELAETSEATANELRTNLQHYLLLAQQQPQQLINDEAESCCNADNMNMMMMNHDDDHRLCKCCGEMESCVLLLPCRHLSLCTLCGSSVHVCPVCNSPKTASVHVNFSNS